MHKLYILLSALLASPVLAAGTDEGSLTAEEGLMSAGNWTVESESPDYSVTFNDDGSCEILAPKGLTFWFNEKLSGNLEITYEATVYTGREDDRLSDLNCFWMASDPEAESVFERMDSRNGVFANCAQLRLYYVGYGGNYNSTTRFRRYTGEPNPEIIAEYSDSEHLLKANHWYSIRLVCRDGRVQYWIDGELLFDYDDSEPYTEGWFGFRTTLSRTGLRNFSVRQLQD